MTRSRPPADEDRLWFSDVEWCRAVWDRMRGEPQSLTASASIVGPPADPTARSEALRAARLAYARALARQVHPPGSTRPVGGTRR